MTQHKPPEGIWSPPVVAPRLIAAFAAGAAALAGALVVALVVAAGAAVVVGMRGTRAERLGAFWGTMGVMVASVSLTPAWLHLLAGVPLARAFDVAAALALRLGAVLLVGAALSLVVPTGSWLGAFARWPRVALAVALTFRQVPELADDVERIRTAQRGRGLHLGWGAWRPRAVLIPLLHRALARADRFGDQLVLAGWGRPGRRRAHANTRGRADLAWWSVAGAALAALLLL